MQSILVLVYISIPLTIGVRNYQNSMIGMFNSGVPKVPNSQNIYELYHKGIKKARQVKFQKISEDETPPEPDQISVYNQDDLANPNQEFSVDIDLRRQNSANTDPPKLSLDFPIPGSHVGEYNPYPTSLRQREDGINIDSESFAQYFPVPPVPQGREENDILVLERGEKDMFLPRIGENDGPIVQSNEYSSPPIGRAIGEKYNGGNNGFEGVNNGHNGEINDYNQDVYEDNEAIKTLTPTDQLIATSFDQVSKQQALLEIYKKRITDTLNGKLKEKHLLGYNEGSNEFNGVSNSFNGGSNGSNGGSSGYIEGSNGFNAGLYVVESGSNGSNGVSNGINGGLNGFKGSNGAKQPVRQGYNIQYTGMKPSYKGDNGDKIAYYKDVPVYFTRVKDSSHPEESWTSKSIDIYPEQQELVDQYKRIFNMFNQIS